MQYLFSGRIKREREEQRVHSQRRRLDLSFATNISEFRRRVDMRIALGARDVHQRRGAMCAPLTTLFGALPLFYLCLSPVSDTDTPWTLCGHACLWLCPCVRGDVHVRVRF